MEDLIVFLGVSKSEGLGGDSQRSGAERLTSRSK